MNAASLAEVGAQTRAVVREAALVVVNSEGSGIR